MHFNKFQIPTKAENRKLLPGLPHKLSFIQNCFAHIFADANAVHSSQQGMVTVEMDMVFPEDEYLKMIDEYVRGSLFESVSSCLIFIQNWIYRKKTKTIKCTPDCFLYFFVDPTPWGNMKQIWHYPSGWFRKSENTDNIFNCYDTKYLPRWQNISYHWKWYFKVNNYDNFEIKL